MKRMWIGAGLLTVLLAAGLLTGHFLEKKLEPAAGTLRQAGRYAMAGEWEKTEALTDSVRVKWISAQPLAGALTTHDKVEGIDTAFAQLDAYAGDGPAYSALCIALAAELEGIVKAHACSWENFF